MLYNIPCKKVEKTGERTRPVAACTISKTAAVWTTFSHPSMEAYSVGVLSVRMDTMQFCNTHAHPIQHKRLYTTRYTVFTADILKYYIGN